MSDDAILLTDDQFNKYVRDHFQSRLDSLPDKSLMPMLWVLSRDYDGKEALDICMIAANFNEAEEKRQLLFGIGAKFFEKKKRVIAVILSTEAWTAKQDPLQPKRQPRDDPNRQEVIFTVGSGINQAQRLCINQPVKRDAENKIVVDGPPDELTDVAFPLLVWFWKGYFAKFPMP